jgi:hypothetical protein
MYNEYGYNIAKPTASCRLVGDNYNKMCKKMSETRIKTGISKGKNNGRAVLCIINGIKYDTIAEASQSLGFNRKTIRERIKKTKSNNIILFKNDGILRGKNSPRAKAVIANYKNYDTVTEASRSIGVCDATLLARINRNEPGYTWDKHR